MMRPFVAAVVVAFLGPACSPALRSGSSGLAELAIAAESDVTQKLEFARNAANNARWIEERFRFVSGVADYTRTRVCRSNADQEARLAEIRIQKFNWIIDYFRQIRLVLERKTEAHAKAEQARAVIGKLEKPIGIPAVDNAAGGLTAILRAVIDARELIEEADHVRKLIANGKGLHTRLVDAINDVSAGLKTLDAATNANLKLWEECEYQLLFHLRDSGAVDKVALEARYLAYQRLRDAITVAGGVKDASSDPLRQLIDVHARLINFDVRHVSLNDILSLLDGAVRIGEEVAAARDRAKPMLALMKLID